MNKTANDMALLNAEIVQMEDDMATLHSIAHHMQKKVKKMRSELTLLKNKYIREKT